MEIGKNQILHSYLWFSFRAYIALGEGQEKREKQDEQTTKIVLKIIVILSTTINEKNETKQNKK